MRVFECVIHLIEKMKKSYLIRNNKVIAYCEKTTSRDAVYAYCTSGGQLVNTRKCKISNANKWEKQEKDSIFDLATEIHEDSFLIQK